MKKNFILACVSILTASILLFSACGSSAAVGSSADYKSVLESSRPAELNEYEMYAVVTSSEDTGYDLMFNQNTGLSEDVMQKYAVSLGSVITLAYGVAIILPQDGQEQAVIDGLKAYVETQKNAQENYLPDQYEIASSAIIETVPTGEVLLAMCENASDVMEAMKEGLSS